MHYFKFKGNNLYCEDLKIKDLASRFGTPLYVYSARTACEHLAKLRSAFATFKPLICYSVKANSNLSLLKLLVSCGAGLDIVSGGELYRAKKIKCLPKKIVYASVGKTDQEIKDAVNYGILMFNIESIAELRRIGSVAKELKKKVCVALRFNPDVDPKTHKYVTTGKKETKFGMDYKTIKEIFHASHNYPNLIIAGLHMHIGSQITQGKPFIDAIKKAKKLIKNLGPLAKSLKYLNVGGGLGIVYDKEKPQTAKEFSKKISPLLKSINLKIVFEPGRFIIGNAGILVTKVIYTKEAYKKRFIIVDAAMNDLLRPSLYDAYHKIVEVENIQRKPSKNKNRADVVGPICESGDFLGKDRDLDLKDGKYLAVLGAGAYGFSMSSNYNSRRRPAEILVRGNRAYLIRKREDFKDLTKGELII